MLVSKQISPFLHAACNESAALSLIPALFFFVSALPVKPTRKYMLKCALAVIWTMGMRLGEKVWKHGSHCDQVAVMINVIHLVAGRWVRVFVGWPRSMQVRLCGSAGASVGVSAAVPCGAKSTVFFVLVVRATRRIGQLCRTFS